MNSTNTLPIRARTRARLPGLLSGGLRVVSLLCAGLLAAHGLTLDTLNAAQSQIGFTFKQMGVPVDGRFSKFDAKLAMDPAHPEAARGRIDIDVASIDAGSTEANGEVRGKNWFDAQAFPSASFRIDSVKSLGADRYEVTGPLTLRGRTKVLGGRFTLKRNGDAAQVDGTVGFKRSDFGIGQGEWADPSIVADDIQVNFHLQLTGS